MTLPDLPPAPRTKRSPVRMMIGTAAASAIAVAGITYGVTATDHRSTDTTSAHVPSGWGGWSGGPQAESGSQPQDSTQDSSGTADASAAQSVGVVDINTTMPSGRAAGTGMVLTSDGEILTNNHVVEGSTSISVRVVSTDQTYTARVVGTDVDDDVAVLQLKDASNLDTVDLDSSGDLAVGDAVTGVGNAGGDGGAPSAAPGVVTGLGRSVTTQSEGNAAGETLDGMIQIDADIAAGDSGGPLYDSAGEVVGIDTAASSGTPNVTGFAIPIERALQIVDRIENGETAGGITIGYPAFLGVQLGAESDATIAGVVDGSGAADAGLESGDTITSIGGTSIDSSSAISDTLAGYQPGDRVDVTWLDSAGSQRSASVTLGEGPAA